MHSIHASNLLHSSFSVFFPFTSQQLASNAVIHRFFSTEQKPPRVPSNDSSYARVPRVGRPSLPSSCCMMDCGTYVAHLRRDLCLSSKAALTTKILSAQVGALSLTLILRLDVSPFLVQLLRINVPHRCAFRQRPLPLQHIPSAALFLSTQDQLASTDVFNQAFPCSAFPDNSFMRFSLCVEKLSVVRISLAHCQSL